MFKENLEMTKFEWVSFDYHVISLCFYVLAKEFSEHWSISYW